jgi:hypothetical protein
MISSDQNALSLQRKNLKPVGLNGEVPDLSTKQERVIFGGGDEHTRATDGSGIETDYVISTDVMDYSLFIQNQPKR